MGKHDYLPCCTDQRTEIQRSWTNLPKSIQPTSGWVRNQDQIHLPLNCIFFSICHAAFPIGKLIPFIRYYWGDGWTFKNITKLPIQATVTMNKICPWSQVLRVPLGGLLDFLPNYFQTQAPCQALSIPLFLKEAAPSWSIPEGRTTAMHRTFSPGFPFLAAPDTNKGLCSSPSVWLIYREQVSSW